MPTIDPTATALLIIDFQSRLMPAIDNGTAAIVNAKRLLGAAALLDIPICYTEQNPDGLGPTVPELQPGILGPVLPTMTFDACRDGGLARLPNLPGFVVAGCEAHVCVLQTVLGLLAAGRRVYLVSDAVGARQPDSKTTALRRMERHGAEIVTTEMVVFEWLGSADHPKFRDALRLVK